MKKSFSLLIVLCTFSVAAADDPKSKIQIHAFDRDVDLSKLDDQNFHKTSASDAPKNKTPLPSPKKLNQLFLAAGLDKEIQSMEQMDKDLLYLKLDARELSDVISSYPNIASDKLTKLKQLIRESK